MPRNPRYDVLFEPVRIGPVTAPNRFYQTPHATGMGQQRPLAGAALRAVKAEGGWGVVSTEYCSIHPSSEDSPFAFLSLWDEGDVAALARTAEAIHAHGSLAAVELWHGGAHAANRWSREPLLSPSGGSARYTSPAQVRAMDAGDLRDLRRWQRLAAERAKRAGFDIVYVYAGHDYLPFQFLSPRSNRRTDAYGGSLANRSRLVRELIEETREAVGPSVAVAVRLAVDELMGTHGITSEGEGREIVSMLAELPDLWDFALAGALGYDSKSARFSEEGFQEPFVTGLKALTTKPVVSVGRFTSPDRMVSQIRRGIQDFIGAARPSIADPFLPRKIDEGREDEIRECIGCNICRSANNEGVPLRCTQNPTMGEEHRRGWHPERVPGIERAERVLVVGGGPAGLECALTLVRRGHAVTLAEAGRELGGRLLREARLPGLSTWMRVRDWRQHMLGKLGSVEIFRESRMTAEDVLGLGVRHVAIATGSRWRRDGVGTSVEAPVAGLETPAPGAPRVLTPDDLALPEPLADPVVIYDDEHYATAGALAERLAGEDRRVTLVTPLPIASSWTQLTDEQAFVQIRLLELGVEIVPLQLLATVTAGGIEVACAYSGRRRSIEAATLVLVTGRMADDALWQQLASDPARLEAAGIVTLGRIGDCLVPGTVADAVFRGHRWARELGEPADRLLFRRELPPV